MYLHTQYSFWLDLVDIESHQPAQAHHKWMVPEPPVLQSMAKSKFLENQYENESTNNWMRWKVKYWLDSDAYRSSSQGMVPVARTPTAEYLVLPSEKNSQPSFIWHHNNSLQILTWIDQAGPSKTLLGLIHDTLKLNNGIIGRWPYHSSRSGSRIQKYGQQPHPH